MLGVRFYRVGGGTRVAGFLLAVMTALLLFIGTAPIAYIREHMQSILFTYLDLIASKYSGCGCRSANICTGHRSCQGSFVGYETPY